MNTTRYAAPGFWGWSAVAASTAIAAGLLAVNIWAAFREPPPAADANFWNDARQPGWTAAPVAEAAPETAAPAPAAAVHLESAASAVSRSGNPGPVVASRNSKVFHRPDCPHAKKIKPANRVEFPTVQEALQAGLKPAKNCLP